MSAAAFDPEAQEAEDFDTACTHIKFKVLFKSGSDSQVSL